MPARPAAGGGRWVDVDPVRLPGWLNGFGVRHGAYEVVGVDDALRIQSADGSTLGLWSPPGAAPYGGLEDFIAEALQHRRIGLLLARKASVAIGVADGPRLVLSKVDTFYVQSRTAAGGWSQHRYARRRENQAKAASESAADLAVRILLPELASLTAIVTGGDRRTIESILADVRLAPAIPLVAERFLAVGEPRKAELEHAIEQARAVRILVRDPPVR
jgi:hypothetical protein